MAVEKLLGIEVPAAGADHPRAGHGAQPDRLAPGLAGHRRHGARRADRDDQRLPRARDGPRPPRGDHRPADEPRLHPPRRPGAGPARGRRSSKIREFLEDHAEAGRRLPPAAHRPADLAAPAQGRRLPRRHRLPRARRHRPDAARRRPALGPAQGRAVPRLRDLRLRGADRRHRRRLGPLPGPDGRDARVAEDHRAGARPARARPGHGRGPEDRLAGAARRSAPTAWATPSTTCGTSWASRWRP